MCEGTKYDGPDDRYLDHDPGDTTTHRFFTHQARTLPEYRRAYLDEIYALIDGVAQNLGRAVVSRHLVVHDKRIHVLPKWKSMAVPVVLHHHKQAYYTRLQRAAIAALVDNCPGLLGSKRH